VTVRHATYRPGLRGHRRSGLDSAEYTQSPPVFASQSSKGSVQAEPYVPPDEE